MKQHENVEIIRLKMNFRQIIIKYGYPMIGKEVAGCVYGARRYVEKLAEREKNSGSGEIIPNYSYMADLVGIDRPTIKSQVDYWKNLKKFLQEKRVQQQDLLSGRPKRENKDLSLWNVRMFVF